MYENNLFIKDGIMYYTTYGCSKQYIFTNKMWKLSVLTFIYRVVIDRCVNYHVHSRSKIDGINRSKK